MILSFKFTRQLYFYVSRICKETLLNRMAKLVWRYYELSLKTCRKKESGIKM